MGEYFCALAERKFLRTRRGGRRWEKASWCSGSTSDSKSDNGGSIPSEVTFCQRSPMAQSVARQAVNLQVAGSNPAGGVLLPSASAQRTQTAGFEPAHAEHTRLAGEPRNHLGTSALRTGRHNSVSNGVVVSTQDSESCDRGSNPRGRSAPLL